MIERFMKSRKAESSLRPPPDKSLTLQAAVKRFLTSYLPQHRGASGNTICSYAQALKGLLASLSGRGETKREPTFYDFTAENILAYLSTLEDKRGNGPATRNARLAAIRSFMHFAFLMGALEKEKHERLLHIAFKRAPEKVPVHLDPQELEAIFRAVDYRTHDGFRDLTILKLMYNTGMRATETALIRVSDLELDDLRLAVTGKGNKRRLCGLWQTTAALLRIYLASERRTPAPGFEDFLFLSQLRKPYTRGGIHMIVRTYVAKAASSCASLTKKVVTPHTLRHTTGVHLVEAGVDLNTIREWLGHAHMTTTEVYARASLRMKHQALAKLVQFDQKLFNEVAASRAAPPVDSRTRRWLDSLEG